MSGSPPAIVRLAIGQLGGTGPRTPVAAFTTPSAGLASLAAVAFDREGDLWIASTDDGLLLELAAGDLTASVPRPAATVLVPVAGSLGGPTGLAFDRTGRLWVANHETGTLVAFEPSQLAAGGAVFPAVVLSGAGHPTALAFDAAALSGSPTTRPIRSRVMGHGNSRHPGRPRRRSASPGSRARS